jgi:DNA-binding response OmpR family regulator
VGALIGCYATKEEANLAKIMLVDDDRTTTSLLQTLLELDGFDVVVVSRGADVMPALEKSAPDVVLMDYHLTDAHGVDILRQMRASARWHSLPVIMVSGMNMRDEVMAAGANEFLIKPFEPNELPQLFNRYIS